MKIALYEPFPILENLLRKRLKSTPYFPQLLIESARSETAYDLILSDRRFLPRNPPFTASLFLVPGARFFSEENETGILRGGMGTADDVTFSSIGEDRALLCVDREIPFFGQWIGPFEKPVLFDRNVSLYKNLATGFAAALTQIRFGED